MKYIQMNYENPVPSHSATKDEFIRWRFNEISSYEEIIKELASIVYDGQKAFTDDLSMELCIDAVNSVITKREFQHTLCTAINLDVLCENGMLLGPLQASVWEDRGTFGVDETLISVAQIYGSIGVSNAYNLDKVKPGIIGKVDKLGKNTEYCHTFLDDMLCAVAGSAMGKIAHSLDTGNPMVEIE